uniref:Uncharacterized protein n=1 Tax=Glossina austeni TaxID=7395 RepID=A0A1A9VMB3_GLOAU
MFLSSALIKGKGCQACAFMKAWSQSSSKTINIAVRTTTTTTTTTINFSISFYLWSDVVLQSISGCSLSDSRQMKKFPLLATKCVPEVREMNLELLMEVTERRTPPSSPYLLSMNQEHFKLYGTFSGFIESTKRKLENTLQQNPYNI